MLHGWFALSDSAIWTGVELLLLGLIVGVIAHLLTARSRAMVYSWAAHGGWEVVRCRRCHLFAGGQFILPSVPVFHVVLRSRSGRERAAIVRVGNLVFGALSDELGIEWVETAGR